MVIVEGPDGAGKTTLINRLCAELGVEIRPRSSTSDHGPVDDVWEWVKRDLITNVDRDIYDRHPFISESIYGPVLRGEMRLGPDPEEQELHYGLFLHHRPLVIYCMPPLKQVRFNVAQNHDGQTDHTRGVLRYIDTIYALYQYRAMMDRHVIETLHWDYTGETLPGFPLADHYRMIVDEVARKLER